MNINVIKAIFLIIIIKVSLSSASDDFTIELRYGLQTVFMNEFNNNYENVLQEKFKAGYLISPRFSFLWEKYSVGVGFYYSKCTAKNYKGYFISHQHSFYIDGRYRLKFNFFEITPSLMILYGKSDIMESYSKNGTGLSVHDSRNFGLSPYVGIQKRLYKFMIGIDLGFGKYVTDKLKSENYINGIKEYYDEQETKLDWSGFWIAPRISFIW